MNLAQQPFRRMGMQTRLVNFDRVFTGVTVAGDSRPIYSESEMAAAKAAAYREGYDKARVFSDRQLVEFRGEVQTLQQGLLRTLPTLGAAMEDQLRAGLPLLVIDLARRLLAGFEPSEETVQKLCVEALDHLYPEREGLELIVSHQDAALLEKHQPDLETRYPSLKIRSTAALKPGDCQVRSRFGLTDASLNAKLEALHHELIGST
jgi:flagellar assembly protein FliH